MSDDHAGDVDRGWFADGLLPRAEEEEGLGGSAAELAENDPERYERLEAAIALYAREISASVDPRRRAALSYEVGRIYERELGDDRKAIAFYQRAVSADPTHVPTLRAGRRVFGRAGRWAMVLKLLDAEIRGVPEGRERARLLREKGEIYLSRFDRPAAARICFLQALDFVPDDAAAARGLTTAAALAGDARAFAAAAERAARAARGDAIGRAMALEAAAGWAALGDAAAAVRLLRRVVEEAPEDRVAWVRLADALRQAGDVDGWLDAADRIAEWIADPERRAARRAGLARVAAEHERGERAIALWESALADDAARTEDRRRLAQALEGAGLLDRAAEVWSRVADELLDPAVRVDALWRLAGLYEGPLADRERALSTLGRLLEIDPAHGPAVRRVFRLASARRDWRRLAAVLGQCAETADDPLRAAAAGLALGRVREERLDDRPGAVSAYRAALARDPRALPIVEALAAAEAALGDWRGHLSTLEHALTLHAEVEARIEVLARIAEVAERRLMDAGVALDAWLRVRGLRPDDARATQAIERLSATTEEPSPSPPPALSGAGAGPASRAELWLIGARMAWLHLGDREHATRCAQRAVEADPARVDARALLDELRRPDGRAARIDRTLARIDAAASTAEQVPLCLVLAELRAADGDVSGAVEALERAVELAPDHRVALRALEDACRASGRLDRAAEALVAQAELAEDAAERATALVRLGALYGGPLGQPETAADAWERAIEAAGDAPDAARALLDAGDDPGLLAALHARLATRAALPAEAVVHWQAVASLAEQLDEPDRAIAALEAARAAAPQRIEPLLALERHRLARRAFPELAALYDELAGLATTPAIRAELRLARARVAEGALDDLRMAFEAYEDVLAEIPDHPEALEWMEGWADAAGDLSLLAEILERRLARAVDPRERAMILLRAGRVLRAAEQLEEAARCYEAVRGIDPDSPIALRALREIYEDLGERRRAIEITERQGRAALDPQNASLLLVEAGRSREIDQKAAVEALADYRAALARNPADDEAAAAVRRLCEQLGRWAELAAAVEARAEALPERRRALLDEAITLYVDRLGAPRDAVRVLKRLIPEADAADVPPLLQRLADLYTELEDWPAAAATYERLRTISPDPALRRAVAFRLVAIFRDKAPDPDRARGWLKAVLDADPGDVDALEKLADLALSAGEPDRARIALARAVNAAAPGPRRAGLRRRIARMDLEQQRFEAALAGLEAAVEDVPDDPRLLEMLADACLDAGRPARARAALHRALAVADPRSAIAERLRERVAEAVLAEGTDPAELIESLRSAVGERPDDSALRTLFAEALGRRSEHLPEAIEQLRWLLGRAPLDPAHLRALRRQLVQAGELDVAGEIARLRVAAGVADADDTGLLGGPGDGVRPLARPLPDEARVRLWAGVDPAFVEHLRTLAGAVPTIFGPRPPSRAASPARVAEVGALGALVGVSLVPEVGPLPLDVVQRVGDGLVISERLGELPPPERAFFIVTALALAREGVDVLTRWAPDALKRRLMAIALCAGHPVKEDVDPRVREQAQRLRKRYAEPLRAPETAAALDGLVLGLAAVPAQARSTLAAAHRVGLLAAGGVGPASRALARTVEGPGVNPTLVELARFATGAHYAELRSTLGRTPVG